MADDCPPVSVSLRIAAPADAIFALLADPSRHPDIDGSGMVQGPVASGAVTGVGDVFVMRMRSRKKGEYEINNHVVEFVPGRRIAWEPAAGRGLPEEGTPRMGHRWTYELAADGPDATVVTETYDCSRAPESERIGMANGEMWREAMADTLARLARHVE